MCGFVFFGRGYLTTTGGSRIKQERCIGCSTDFSYLIKREVTGTSYSLYHLDNHGAAQRANERARANLNRALNEAIEPVHCPTCGIFQPDMVQLLRQRLGKRYEPNKYASERIAVPVSAAWRMACETNTMESYTKFMEVWPTFKEYAEKQIKELRYRPHLRKAVSSLVWVGWAALVLFVVGVTGTSFQDELESWWTGLYQPKPLSAPPKISNSYASSDYTSGMHPPMADFRSVDPQTTPTCPWSPTNGQILAGHIPATGQGHTLEIRNGTGGNAIVKVRDAFSGRLITSFFVANDADAEVVDLPDGNYPIQYAFGNKLRQDCRSFITVLEAGQFPNERLETEYTNTQIVWSHLRYTLFSVPSGNVKPQNISIATFELD